MLSLYVSVMKRIVFLITVFLTAILLTSCVVNPALDYEDCFDELDISGRVNALAYEIAHGKTDARLYRRAEVMIEDLKSIRSTADETLGAINDDFIVVVQTLMQAMDYKKANNLRAYSDCYYAAKELYNQTDRRLNQYKKTSWSITDDNG